jgi:hypothetical protein
MMYNNSAKRNGGSAMPDTILRKCGGCSDAIEINRDNVVNILYYKNKYYHSKCFCEIAEKRSKAKRNTAVEWQTALGNLLELEADTKKMLEAAWVKDDLNEWLLNHYNITSVPTRFWQIVADLGNGMYKGKRCKPVSMETLLGAWKWGQRKLNKINVNNKAKNNWKMDDSQRILYDLAIIVSKVPLYLLKKIEKEATERERQLLLQEKIKIDYKSVAKKAEELDDDEVDISSIIDNIF